MKFYITINYEGEARIISITPESYLGRKVYQVEQPNIIIYQDENEWKTDTDHQLEDEFVRLIGKQIEDSGLMDIENVVLKGPGKTEINR
ncbi:MAG TPA: hypothetical protein VIM89_09345 [Mucilaginibacter sp.]